MSLDAERAQASPRGDAGRCARAAIALAGAVLTLAACGGAAPPPGSSPVVSASAEAVTRPAAPAATAQTLSETGSSMMAPLLALWGPAYHARFSQVSLRTTSSSGTGNDSAAAGTADIGASDAYLSPATLAKHPHLVNIPLAVAALAGFTDTPAVETISLVNGSGARAHPIVSYEYAIVSTVQGSAVRARDLRAFLSWAITSGAAQLARLNFQPLPSSVVTLSGTQIARIEG